MRKYLMNRTLCMAFVLLASLNAYAQNEGFESFISDDKNSLVPAGPLVVSTEPRAGEPGVTTDAKISLIFDRDMVKDDLNRFTLSVNDGASDLSGEIFYSKRVLTFLSRDGLGPGRKFTVSLAAGVRATDGSTLQSPFVFTFSTKNGPTLTELVQESMSGARESMSGSLPEKIFLEVSGSDPVAFSENVDVITTVSMSFSMALDEKTVNPFTIMLKDETRNIPGEVKVSDDGMDVIFMPSNPLENDTTYRVIVTRNVYSKDRRRLRADHSFLFRTVKAPEIHIPDITGCYPLDESVDVKTDTSVAVTFTKPMNMETFNRFTVTLNDGEQNVWGDILYNQSTKQAIFKPQGELAPGRWHTLKIRPGVEDLDGLTIESERTFRFKTETTRMIHEPEKVKHPAVEPRPHTVDSIDRIESEQRRIEPVTYSETVFEILRSIPAANAENAAVDGPFKIIFNRPCLPSTINSFTITVSDGRSNLWGTVKYDGKSNTAEFTPKEPLKYLKTYHFFVSDAVTDIDGRRLKDSVTIDFKTEEPPDRNPPEIEETVPADNSENNERDTFIIARFNEAIRPMSLNQFSFRVYNEQEPVTGTITYDYEKYIASFMPSQPLKNGEWYRAVIGRAVADESGNYLDRELSWRFLVGEPIDREPPVILRVSPVDGAIVTTGEPMITVTLNEPVQTVTVNPFVFHVKNSKGVEIHGRTTWSPISLMARFIPLKPLPYGTYNAVIEPKIRDMAGNTMEQQYVWTFTVARDKNAAPEVEECYPPANGSGIPVESEITIKFTHMMNPVSFNRFTVKFGTVDGDVPYTSKYDRRNSTLSIIPVQRLKAGKDHVVMILREVQDTRGRNMKSDFTLHFKTEIIESQSMDSLVEDIHSTLEPTSLEMNIPGRVDRVDPTLPSERTDRGEVPGVTLKNEEGN